MRSLLITQLMEHLAAIDSPEEIRWLLEQLLTDRELHDIGDRLHIYSLLVSGEYSQRAIAQLAKVSISKVERGASNARSPKVRAYFRKHFPA
ncbi:transcriptional regulator [Xanthomonas cerealis pv. cerealis]|uniref:Transcriptional regulator n=2 Tax=Xanthomonas translucens group TaxID=3390202 RepID=A0A514EBR6_9XANT|nr:transcriptional regulator [Xanthomonas translucens pv. cerealis]